MDDRLVRPEPGRLEGGIPIQMWYNVKGGDAVKGTTNIPEGIKKIDANTVELTLKAPDSTFLRRIAGAVYYIQPKHILDGLTAARGGRPASSAWAPSARRSAPARTTSPSPSRPPARRFKAKKNYWKGKDSQIDNIVYKIQESNVSVGQLAAGELDLSIRVPPAEGPGLASTSRASSS